MQPTAKKNPFSDEVDTSATDPANLYTGSGSQMFRNEQTNKDSKRVKELESKRAEQSSQLLPVAKDLLAFLAEKKVANADFRSFLTRLRGGGDKPKKQLTEAQVRQLAVQAEAREMNNELIEELERWVMSKIRRNN